MARGVAIPPFLRAWVRRCYEQNPHMTIEEIARHAGVTASAVSHMAKREEWVRASGAVRARKGADDAVVATPMEQGPLSDAPCEERRMLLDALWLTASRHVAELQGAAGAGGDTATAAQERARDTQALMTTVRTVEKLMDMEAEIAAAPPPVIDEGPADIDEFRNEIARRLEALLGKPPGCPQQGCAEPD
jgi:hypothetical protein